MQANISPRKPHGREREIGKGVVVLYTVCWLMLRKTTESGSMKISDVLRTSFFCWTKGTARERAGIQPSGIC